MSNTDTMKQVYLLAQEHCGLKVGDWVRVTREAENYEGGRHKQKSGGVNAKIKETLS